MCGIVGIVTRDGTLPDESVLRHMSTAIAHRGPDGEGFWTAPGVGFAHRRLAIIDLGLTGAQPMHDARGALTIVYNGEIYNYRKLRAELESLGATFRSSSDTEVILEAYHAWGIDSLKRFHGMFAIALWDAPKKTLILARDRIGKKPLFYGFTSSRDLVFASELKGLAPALDMKPDWDAVRLFLGLQYVPSPRTGFQEMMQLKPGEYGVWNEHGWQLKRYHTWEKNEQKLNVVNLDAEIRSKLEEAVKIRQFAADVPVGAFLSGGIDSASIVAFASKNVSHPLQTFTMGFDRPKMDERVEARVIAQAFKTDHYEFEATPNDLVALVDKIVCQYDAPYADSSALPLWLLARETAQEVKVVLTGDGGDELFGGYRRYIAYQRALDLVKLPGMAWLVDRGSKVVARSLKDPRILRMAETVHALQIDPATAYGELFCGSYFSTARLRATFDDDFLQRTESEDAVQFVSAHMGGTDDATSLRSAMQFDLTSYLPDDLNVKMDRATMRFGLEARAPFLDQKLIAFALAIPLKEKIYHGMTKVALRRALKGIVPDDVLTRKKRGFQVPLAEWFRGPLRTIVRDRLMDPHAPIAEIVQADAVTRLIAENDAGADHGNRLWMLLTLSSWLSHYV